jgi:hypothetical protein
MRIIALLFMCSLLSCGQTQSKPKKSFHVKFAVEIGGPIGPSEKNEGNKIELKAATQFWRYQNPTMKWLNLSAKLEWFKISSSYKTSYLKPKVALKMRHWLMVQYTFIEQWNGMKRPILSDKIVIIIAPRKCPCAFVIFVNTKLEFKGVGINIDMAQWLDDSCKEILTDEEDV